ncbi:MAG TPA: hypothetical protein PLA50_02705 [Bacteroidia bacterium]|nr:hypothetical protein [Bacteroidia bacterium]
MSDLAQIVCLRPNGRDPRTVVEMGPRTEILAKFDEVKDGGWPGKEKRPVLEVWSDSGAKIAPAPAPVPDKNAKKK